VDVEPTPPIHSPIGCPNCNLASRPLLRSLGRVHRVVRRARCVAWTRQD
jgi:hypothetical protein